MPRTLVQLDGGHTTIVHAPVEDVLAGLQKPGAVTAFDSPAPSPDTPKRSYIRWDKIVAIHELVE